MMHLCITQCTYWTPLYMLNFNQYFFEHYIFHDLFTSCSRTTWQWSAGHQWSAGWEPLDYANHWRIVIDPVKYHCLQRLLCEVYKFLYNYIINIIVLQDAYTGKTLQ